MSKRAILLLAAVVAGLVGYIALFERTSVTSKELAERGNRVLVTFVRDKVERLEVQRQGKRVVLVRKLVRAAEGDDLSGWRMIEPVEAKADSDAIDPLLGELEWLSARRTLEGLSAEDEQRFGLSAPRYRVTYVVGGARHLLELGHEDVHGDGVYARVDREQRAFVVPKSVIDPLNHEPGHFRQKELFPDLVVAWARKVTIDRGGATVALSREGGRWFLAETPKVYADAKRVGELVEMTSALRATRYLEPGELPAAEASLKEPWLRLAVDAVPDESREDRTSVRFRLEVGGPCGTHEHQRYVRVLDGPLGCIADGDLKVFESTSDTLRERRLFAEDRSAISAFELTRGGATIALSRDGERWKAKSGDAVDRDAVEAFLVTLAAAEASGFAPLAGFTERGALTLQLDHEKRERIALGELDAHGELLVRRNDEPQLVRYPGGVADVLAPTRARFQSLEVWAAHQPSQIVRAEARADGHARSWQLESGSWKLSAGDLGGDVGRLRELLRALIDLRARVYVTDRARAVHGVSPGSASLRLGLVSGESLSLTLGAETPRGAYAQLESGAVIEVEREVVGWVKELAGGPRAPVEPSAAEDDEGEDEHDHAPGDGHDHAH